MPKRESTKKARQRERLIQAMLQHPGLEKAAAAAGISPTTAWRVSRTPEFHEEYRTARRECFSQAMARLQQASGAAVSTLLKIMLAQNAPAAYQLRAANSVLDYAAKALEREDIEERLSALERFVEAAKTGGQ
jgi:hypothetical protein